MTLPWVESGSGTLQDDPFGTVTQSFGAEVLASGPGMLGEPVA